MQVVLFHLRGCPSGWLGAYGNEWVGTPNLDRFAAEGIVFDRHIAESPRPDPGAARLIPSPAVATAGRLKLHDFENLIPPWTVPQEVFEAYIDDPDEERDIAEERIEPWSDPPIGPFDRTDRAAWEWLHTTFAAVMTALDAELGRTFDELRNAGLDRTATWVLTSDFGYPLGEHGQIGLHRPWLHEELVHLPLLVRLPDAEQAGRRVAAFTQPSDLTRTLGELLGTASPSGFSLLPLLRGEGEPSRSHAVTRFELGGAAEVALRTDDWAYLHPVQGVPDEPRREAMLFAKPDDRWEVNDLRGRNVEIADALAARL